MSIDTAVDVEAAIRRLVSDVSGLPSDADAQPICTSIWVSLPFMLFNS